MVGPRRVGGSVRLPILPRRTEAGGRNGARRLGGEEARPSLYEQPLLGESGRECRGAEAPARSAAAGGVSPGDGRPLSRPRGHRRDLRSSPVTAKLSLFRPSGVYRVALRDL